MSLNLVVVFLKQTSLLKNYTLNMRLLSFQSSLAF